MRSYNHEAVEVSDKSVLVCQIPQDIDKAQLRNVGKSVVYLGGEHVSVDDGFPVDPGVVQEIPCFDSDAAALYAITPEGETSELRVLVSS